LANYCRAGIKSLRSTNTVTVMQISGEDSNPSVLPSAA
jgi:hypothetical protein